MIARAVLFAVALMLSALPSMAANAEHPAQNVDKTNDKGGPTGDSKVDELNRGQLDVNQPPTTATGHEAPQTR